MDFRNVHFTGPDIFDPSKKLDKLVTCAVCLERFTDPVTLPCDHTFCRDPCVSRLLEHLDVGDFYRCPKCDASNPYPECGIDELPIPEFILQVMNAPKQFVDDMIRDVTVKHNEELFRTNPELFPDCMTKGTKKGFRPGSQSKLFELRKKHAIKKAMKEVPTKATPNKEGSNEQTGSDEEEVYYDALETLPEDMSATLSETDTSGSQSASSGRGGISESKRKRRRNRKLRKKEGRINTTTSEQPPITVTANGTMIYPDEVPTERPLSVVTYTGKGSDGKERVFWGDPTDPGHAQVYIKDFEENNPDDQGNGPTLMKPIFDSPELAVNHVKEVRRLADMLKCNDTSDLMQRLEEMTRLSVPGKEIASGIPNFAVDDGRIAVPVDEAARKAFNMEELYFQTQLMNTKFKRNGGRAICKKLSREISIRADPGGDNGTPIIRIRVLPRKPEEFDIPKGSVAAAAIEATGLELNQGNFDVEYAADQGHRLKTFLKPKRQKIYERFGDFGFDQWKMPGAGSGVTADGSVVYCVGKDGRIQVKGDNEQDERFQDMVMEALDEVE